MALIYYDIPGGETRELTQDDLDELLAVRASHGRMMSFLAEERLRFMNEVSERRARNAPVDPEVNNA
jgi:hypothetical protein